MKRLRDYIKTKTEYKEEYIIEMATIAGDAFLGKDHYKIAIHGPSSKDRDYPHIHIYLTNDHSLQNFNFEISLIDILTKDEINLIAQKDKKNHIVRTNRSKCSWKGYRKLKDDFEDWLYEKPKGLPGEWQNNLEAIIWYCNHESPNENYVREYIESRGLKILEKFENLM